MTVLVRVNATANRVPKYKVEDVELRIRDGNLGVSNRIEG